MLAIAQIKCVGWHPSEKSAWFPSAHAVFLDKIAAATVLYADNRTNFPALLAVWKLAAVPCQKRQHPFVCAAIPSSDVVPYSLHKCDRRRLLLPVLASVFVAGLQFRWCPPEHCEWLLT